MIQLPPSQRLSRRRLLVAQRMLNQAGACITALENNEGHQSTASDSQESTASNFMPSTASSSGEYLYLIIVIYFFKMIFNLSCW